MSVPYDQIKYEGIIFESQVNIRFYTHLFKSSLFLNKYQSLSMQILSANEKPIH